MDFRLPWSYGAVLAANAVPGFCWRLPQPAAAVREAVKVLREHDLSCRLDDETVSGEGVRPIDDSLGPITIEPPGPGADWLDGYASSLDAAASVVDIPDASAIPGHVAVVGHLMDRLESDRRADAKRLRDLLEEGLGLSVTSVWPDGGDLSNLAGIGGSEMIVSLPYAREAARTLARRTGAGIVEVGLPVGLGGTAAWLREVASKTGRVDEAEACIGKQLDRYVPRMEWIVPHRILHSRFSLIGDPHMSVALAGALRELGGMVDSIELSANGEVPAGIVEAEDDAAALPPDMLLTNRTGVEKALGEGTPYVEMGFPNPGSHSLLESGIFGFEGVAGLVEVIANRMALWEWLKTIEGRRTASTG